MIFWLHERYPTFLLKECLNLVMDYCLCDVSQLDKYIVPKILETCNSGPDLMHLNDNNSYPKHANSVTKGDHTLSVKMQKDLLYNLLSYFSCLVMEDGL